MVVDDDKDAVPLLKPKPHQGDKAAAAAAINPCSARCNKLALVLVGASIAAVTAFLLVARRAENSNPLKILFKDCKSVCKSLKQQRIEKFGGDIADAADLLRLVSQARDKAIQSLKIDYGEKYFSDIFEEEIDGNRTLRRPFGPSNSSAAGKLRRKLQLKILKAQMAALRAQQHDSNGNTLACDCSASVVTAKQGASKRMGNGSRRGRKLQILNNTLPPFDDALSEFIWTTGGHSAAAGHGNLFNESYTAYMERLVKDVFASAGIRFTGKNYAMGAYGSAPETAMCAEAVFGSDTDAVSWDYGMTDWAVYKMYLYHNRAALIPSRPALFAIHAVAGEYTEMISSFEKNGLPAFIFSTAQEITMHHSFPECFGLSTAEINAIPPFARNYKCDGKIESGEPFCGAEKYNMAICPDRHGMAGWHPGWKDQALIGNTMGLFLIETLLEAAKELTSMSGELEKLWEELNASEEADYAAFLDSPLHETLFGFTNAMFGDWEIITPEFNRSVFFRSPTLCHTALLPAETRFHGYVTESEKKSFGDYEKGTAREIVDSNPPSERDKSEMRLTFESSQRQNCPVLVNVDYKDYFYTSSADGWTTLTIPNDSEMKAYRYDSTKIHGIIVVCFSLDRGILGEADLSLDAFDSEKASFEVNGDPVMSFARFDNIYLLKGKNGLKWTPNKEGKFVLKVRVNVDKKFLRISSVVVL